MRICIFVPSVWITEARKQIFHDISLQASGDLLRTKHVWSGDLLSYSRFIRCIPPHTSLDVAALKSYLVDLQNLEKYQKIYQDDISPSSHFRRRVWQDCWKESKNPQESVWLHDSTPESWCILRSAEFSISLSHPSIPSWEHPTCYRMLQVYHDVSWCKMLPAKSK